MGIPVITVEQMRRWEAASWEAGRREEEVIAQVGKLLARRVMELTKPGDAVFILAGKGNNGADARAVEPHLIERRVWVLKVVEPLRALDKIKELLKRGPALVIDGLFGIGLNRDLTPDWCAVIDAVNESGCRVLSVDTPSGLDAQTGEVRGAAVRAGWTMTLGAPKVGLIEGKAAPYVGRLEVVPEIGLVGCEEASDLEWITKEGFSGFPPKRPVEGHKGTFGHVTVLGGSLGYHGAAVLAARAAQRAMPGLVTLCVPESVYVTVASQLQSVMVHPWRAGWTLPASNTAVVIGPGMVTEGVPEELREFAIDIWRTSKCPVIVDASALGWLPTGPVDGEATRVITPHPGEAARMLNWTTGQVQGKRGEALKELSARWGRAWVVLKGRHTLVGRAAGKVLVNGSGNVGLAQGGSGDVLAGYLGGLLAQPKLQEDVLKTISYGVWQHGAAADALAEERKIWSVEEVLPWMGAI
ncbi:MAG TPA: NAD(P)H-hydrate dehydratase [Verrucomicrobiae bacterium]